MGRVTTGESVARAEAQADEVSTTTGDKWVRPSEVSRDRMRTAGGRRGKTELEKAQEAFARAEEVGIDEEGEGVIETRMLRASEVRELLESSAEMEAELTAEMQAPPPTMMEGSEPLPPEAAEMIQPTIPSPKAVEEQILGSRSAFVASSTKDTPKTPEATPFAEIEPPPDTQAEFSSSRYEQAEPSAAPEAPPEIEAMTVPVAPPSPTVSPDMDHVTTCPHCNEVITIDTFDYPKEVYSVMGSARLKQARFLVVQGKAEDAGRILKIAKALFEKGGDEKGMAESENLANSLFG
ncbi:MAG: hypothetical protein ACFFAY_07640 [Promethearchaeota archaeon]